MFRHYSIDTEASFIDVSLDHDLTTVRIQDLTTLQIAHGHARRWVEDRYDENIGIQVALARAVSRLARKNEKYWIRQTEPEK